MHLAKDLQ